MNKIISLLAYCTMAAYSSFSMAGQCPEPTDPKMVNRVGLLPAPTSQVSSLSATKIILPFYLPASADKVTLTFYSPDEDPIRTLTAGKRAQGEHNFEWDGLDDEGKPIPDEAYTPVLTAWIDGKPVVDDPRDYSGGEIIPNMAASWRWSGKSNITLNAQSSFRLLTRAVIEDGPLVKTISQWQAKPKGKVVLRWDGYDQDRLIKVAERDDLSLLVMGYCLPTHTILTFGAKQDNTYHHYREKKNFAEKKPDLSNAVLHRNGRRLEKDHFLPRTKLPEIELSFPDHIKKYGDSAYIVDRATRLKISVPKDQRWLIESSLYELSYFHDYRFIQEEEQGFLPSYWPVDPKDFSPGKHLITVQISAFNGIYISKSVAINIR